MVPEPARRIRKIIDGIIDVVAAEEDTGPITSETRPHSVAKVPGVLASLAADVSTNRVYAGTASGAVLLLGGDATATTVLTLPLFDGCPVRCISAPILLQGGGRRLASGSGATNICTDASRSHGPRATLRG